MLCIKAHWYGQRVFFDLMISAQLRATERRLTNTLLPRGLFCIKTYSKSFFLFRMQCLLDEDEKGYNFFSFGIIFQNTLYGKIVFPFPMINGNFAIIFPLWLFLRGLLFYFARVVFACVFIFPKERCSTAQHSCKQTFCKKRRYKIVSLSVFPL